MTSSNDLTVAENAVLEACGERELPDFGLVEQVWGTYPIPRDRIADRAGEAVASLPLADVPDGGEVAVRVGSRGIANLGTIVSGVVVEQRDRASHPSSSRRWELTQVRPPRASGRCSPNSASPRE